MEKINPKTHWKAKLDKIYENKIDIRQHAKRKLSEIEEKLKLKKE